MSRLKNEPWVGKVRSYYQLFPDTIMSVLATDRFLAHLKSIFPARASSNPWFLVAAVAFSASNRPEEVPRVLSYAVRDVEVEQDKLKLANKVREALFKAGLTSGYSRVCLRRSMVTLSNALH